MTVVSVDLAYTGWQNIGVALLTREQAGVRARLVKPPTGRPLANDVAEWVARLAERHGARIILLDGPQAWKGSATSDPIKRLSEKAFNTPSKTGLPSVVKPAPYTAFTVFSIAVFDALHRLAWPRLTNPAQAGERFTIESYPHASWKGLGIVPLPSKSKARPDDLRRVRGELAQRLGVVVDGDPSHDELQAVVAGLGGLALDSGNVEKVRFAGEEPYLEAGIWREGFIVVPCLAPQHSTP